MAVDQNAAAFPQLGAPFVIIEGPNAGQLSVTGYQLLLALYNRTGGSAPSLSSGDLQLVSQLLPIGPSPSALFLQAEEAALIALFEQAVTASQALAAAKANAKTRIWAPTVATPGRKPGPGEELFKTPITFNTSLPANLIGSSAGCEVAATATAVFTLYKNGVSIGTVTYPPGASGNNVVSFSFSATTAFIAPTDNFSCTSPATQDMTLSGVYLQFLGTIS